MAVFKPIFTEVSNVSDEKRIRILIDNSDELDVEDISTEERKRLLVDLYEKLSVAEAQSASGAPRTSLDDAMNKMKEMIHERTL
ncbi:MAG: hypothetical protein WA125_03505 [Desulfosporosinus sp.]